jgi:hypothetical protein
MRWFLILQETNYKVYIWLKNIRKLEVPKKIAQSLYSMSKVACLLRSNTKR